LILHRWDGKTSKPKKKQQLKGDNMGYNEVWKVLDELIAEFRKRSKATPSEVMEDLRAAKTLIQILKADQKRTENVPSIEAYLGNVESHLMFEAQKEFGQVFTEEWMKKIQKAREAKAENEKPSSSSKFVAGLPRGQKWVRVQVTKDTPEKEIRQLAEETGLSSRSQDDGFMLVYGEGEKLKLFLKKSSEKFGR
jgi:hypothetical protein